MINNNDRISNGQLMAIVINTIIGVGILSLPRGLSESLGTDGWVLIIIEWFIASLLIIMITSVIKRFPQKTFFQYSSTLVTTPIAVIFSIMYIAYILSFSAFVVRLFGEIVKMYLLPKTPIEFIIITMLLTCTYIARAGIEAIGKFAVILIPIVIFPILLMGFILIPNMDFTNIFPVFQFKLMDLIKGIPSTFFSLAGFEFILLFSVFLKKPEKSLKYSILSISVAAFLYIYVFILCLLVFGKVEITHLIWPAMSLMETIEFPGAFIENVQGIVMAQWVLVVFTTLSPLIYGGTLLISEMFKGKEHKYYVLPLIPIIFVLSLVPDNIAQAYDYVNQAIYFLGTGVIIVIPIVLFLVSKFNKNKGKGAEKNG